MMMGFGFLGFVLMVLFWVLLIAGAVLLVRYFFPRGSDIGTPYKKSPKDAREILDQRYAKGEITRDQYLLMSGDLQD